MPPQKLLSKSALLSYFCICVALLLLLGLSVWGAYRDSRYLRTTLLQTEVSRLRSHAERTVGRLERDLEEAGDLAILRDMDLSWLVQRWAEMVPHGEEGLYAALVDDRGTVMLHSNPNLTGQQLERRWYERTVPEAGADVVETRSEVLAGGDPAYDMRVPIILDGREVGDYHVGFDSAWFDSWAAAERNLFLRRRAVILGAILLIVLLATTSLLYIATHAVGLRKAITKSRLDRATEVAQLAAGLAHEIRNPMHVLRINLHVLAKVDDEGRLKLSPAEHQKLLEESNREIQRVEKLMHELVGFASPDDPRDEVIDLKEEVQSTIDFIEREMLRQEITIETHFCLQSSLVRFDPGRLRQILLNLLRNAEQAFHGPGRIDVSISRTSDRVILEIADNGPGIPESSRQRIFEPFYSTKKDGSGLGLALVSRFVKESHGRITCERNGSQGTVFRIEFHRIPRAPSRKQNKAMP